MWRTMQPAHVSLWLRSDTAWKGEKAVQALVLLSFSVLCRRSRSGSVRGNRLVSKGPELLSALSSSPTFTCKWRSLQVEPRGFEPPTSAVQSLHNSFPEVSRACKIPANNYILFTTVFSRFQDIRPGCCTVAAHGAAFRPAWCKRMAHFFVGEERRGVR
jgi:hypothetical protein